MATTRREGEAVHIGGTRAYWREPAQVEAANTVRDGLGLRGMDATVPISVIANGFSQSRELISLTYGQTGPHSSQIFGERMEKACRKLPGSLTRDTDG
jgi:hypothetical protein